MRSFPLLDGYRGIAALMVVTTHVSFSTAFVSTRPFGAMFARFDIGVAIFFLLSGFLLYRSWARAGLGVGRKPNNGTYFRRRLWRILPAYWIVVTFTLLVLPTVDPSFIQALTNLGLMQVYGDGWQLNGLTQMWSLAVEVVFYLALPVIGWIVLKRARGDVDRSFRWQVTVIACCYVIGLTFTGLRTFGPLAPYLGIGFWLPSYLDWFAVGMAAALLHARLELPNPPRVALLTQRLADDTWTCLAIAAALFLVLSTPVGGTYTLLGSNPFGEATRHVLYPIAAFFFLLPGFIGTPSRHLWQRFLMHPGMQFLGLISYGIFLWHLVIRDLIAYYLGIHIFSGGFLWLLPLTVAVTIGFAWISYQLVERRAIAFSHGPSLRARVRARRNRRGISTSAPSAQTTSSDSVTETHIG